MNEAHNAMAKEMEFVIIGQKLIVTKCIVTKWNMFNKGDMAGVKYFVGGNVKTTIAMMIGV